MIAPEPYDMTTGRGLLACPCCDMLHVKAQPRDSETLRCTRCATILARPRNSAFIQLIALSFISVLLVLGIVFLPFLAISRMGFGNATSLFGVAQAYSEGILLPLVLAVLAMIVGLPLLRAILLIYTLVPLAQRRPPCRYAALAFRLSEKLRPWSMAEIFIVGTSIALVKVAGIATVHLGPAFWAFCALALVNLASGSFMCRMTVWDAIEDGSPATDVRAAMDNRGMSEPGP